MVLCGDDAMHATDARRRSTLAMLGSVRGRRGSSRAMGYVDWMGKRTEKERQRQSINWPERKRFGCVQRVCGEGVLNCHEKNGRRLGSAQSASRLGCVAKAYYSVWYK